MKHLKAVNAGLSLAPFDADVSTPSALAVKLNVSHNRKTERRYSGEDCPDGRRPRAPSRLCEDARDHREVGPALIDAIERPCLSSDKIAQPSSQVDVELKNGVTSNPSNMPCKRPLSDDDGRDDALEPKRQHFTLDALPNTSTFQHRPRSGVKATLRQSTPDTPSSEDERKVP